MYLTFNNHISQCFGSDAKWLDLKTYGVKGLVYHSESLTLSRYDHKHILAFISSGTYADLYKRLHTFIGLENRIVFSLEANVLWINVVRMHNETIHLVKKFRCGFVYGRSADEIFESTMNFTHTMYGAEVFSDSSITRDFFLMFTREEINSSGKFDKALSVFEDIRGEPLLQRHKSMLQKQYSKLQA